MLKTEHASEVYDYCTKAGRGCTECKNNLAKIIVEYLTDIRKKRESLLKNKDKLYAILEQGAKKAKKAASETMGEVRKAVGLI